MLYYFIYHFHTLQSTSKFQKIVIKIFYLILYSTIFEEYMKPPFGGANERDLTFFLICEFIDLNKLPVSNRQTDFNNVLFRFILK